MGAVPSDGGDDSELQQALVRAMEEHCFKPHKEVGGSRSSAWEKEVNTVRSDLSRRMDDLKGFIITLQRLHEGSQKCSER